jgi:hypothetical protein
MPANPFQPGSDRLRKTAAWLAGALGAVASIMLAGSQLSSIGSLSATHDLWRLIAAILSALLAVGAVGYAIYQLTSIQMPGEGTLGQIRKAAADPRSRLAVLAADDSGLRAGRESLSVLLDDYERLRQTERQAEDAVLKATTAAQKAQSEAEHRKAALAVAAASADQQDADARIDNLRPYMVTLAQLSSYLEVRQNFDEGRRRILFAALAAAGLLVCFAWAANPSKPETPAASTMPQNPSAGRLVLTSTGVTELSSELSRSCAAAAGKPAGIPVIALAARGATFDVVVIPVGQCTKPARVTVSPALGRVVPSGSVRLSSGNQRESSARAAGGGEGTGQR